MTRPISEGQITGWAVYQCSNKCWEPDGSKLVEERAPIFETGGDESERWTEVEPFICSVCKSP